MKKLERSEAEKLYADWIVEKGNPHFFVYLAIRQWDSYELSEAMEHVMGEEFEVVEEE